MIRVVHSNRIEALVDALAEALPAAGDATGVFDGPWLVVPTRPLTLWLNLELARRRGIAGHVDTMTFDGMFARLTAESQPDVVLVERGHIVGELLGLLDGDLPVAAAPLASYLRAAGDERAAIDRRRVDLALALGRLFDGWTLLRPEALRTWRLSDVEDDAAPLVRAERAVFAALFGRDGRFSRRGTSEGRRYLTRDAFLEAGLAAAWRPPSALHVFAPPDVPPGVQLTLARLGQHTDVRLYVVNPCREFWEDVDTGAGSGAADARPRPAPVTAGGRTRTRGRHVAPDPRQLDLLAPAAVTEPPDLAAPAPAARENPWLAAWGRAGRELVARSNALTDQTFEFRAVEPGIHAGTLLAHVQQDILERRPRREDGDQLALEADGSITVLGAPNPRREIESVAAEIWRLVRADEVARATGAGPSDEPLRFSDIAVLVAGPAEPHLSLVPEVFHEAEELPHAIVDRGFGARSGMCDAVLALASLPLGALTRRDVLDVVTHANVRARFPDTDPGVWLKLCEALTIAHGADHQAHAGTYIDRDAFNWDQGCRRLVLGRFARGPRSGAEEPLPLPSPLPNSTVDDAPTPDAGYSPAEVGAELRDDADALGALMRSLLADVHYARAARLTVSEWMRFVRALMTAYVVPVNPDDEAARLAVLAALHQLSSQAAPETTVPLGVAVELLRAALSELRGARGQMLGAGVVVGALGTLRALPARVIFVVGLEPRRFPSARGPAPLDALAGSGGSPEISPRDTDRSLFLEAVLAARDKLILTTTDRDPLTGESVEPSSVVLDLLDELGRGYVREPAALVRQVPLHRDEDPSVRAAFPTAAAEAQARLLGEAARDAGAPGADEPAALVRGLAPTAREALGPLLGLVPPPGDAVPGARPGTSRRARTTLSLVDLRRFLECPLQGSARVFLGLRDLPDDSEARETTDEPFDLPRTMERTLLNDVLVTAWTGADPPDGDTLARRYDEAAARYRAAHRLPVALFRRNVRRRHLHILGQWAEQAAAAGQASAERSLQPLLGPPRRVCFGRPEPYAVHAEHRPAIRIPVDVPSRGALEVELHGTTEPQVWLGAPGQDTPAGAASLVFATSPYDHNNDCDSFRALIDIMAMAATTPETAAPVERRGYVFRPTRFTHERAPRPYVLAFPDLTAPVARAYLRQLCTALLEGVHGYLFPCDAVLRASRKGAPVTEGIEQTRLDAYYRSRSASNNGPVPNPFDYPAPPEDDAARFRDERFGPLLQALAVPGKSAAAAPGDDASADGPPDIPRIGPGGRTSRTPKGGRR